MLIFYFFGYWKQRVVKRIFKKKWLILIITYFTFMLQKLGQFWGFISYLGVEQKEGLNNYDRKKEIFFNRAIFIGFFAALSNTFVSISFVGDKAYLLLLMNVFIIIGLLLHVYVNFRIAKRIAFYGIMGVGMVMTPVFGPDFLFHFGIINVCGFGFIIFNLREDKFDLFLCVFLAAFGLMIGELRIGDPPNFTNHPDTEIARIMSSINIIVLMSIFIGFIVRMNRESELEISDTVEEKQRLINEINDKTAALKKINQGLENKISDRTDKIREQNRILESQNNEKEILLKEVHHRVKNNLQIIISLINLEISKYESKEVEDALIETQNRVMSMSLVHKKMYQSSNFTEIFLLDYCSQLLENIKHFSGNRSFTSSIEIEENIYLDVEKAIPFGLIVNEIMTNFFKYVVSIEADRHLSVQLRIIENKTIELVCFDTGQGFPENVINGEINSLGLDLIESLAEQLDGQFNVSNNDGAVYQLSFNIQ